MMVTMEHEEDAVIQFITDKAQLKAHELGVEFQVKRTNRHGMATFLVRIKQENVNTVEGLTDEELHRLNELNRRKNQFADYIAEIITKKYHLANDVCFSYPSRF